MPPTALPDPPLPAPPPADPPASPASYALPPPPPPSLLIGEGCAKLEKPPGDEVFVTAAPPAPPAPTVIAYDATATVNFDSADGDGPPGPSGIEVL